MSGLHWDVVFGDGRTEMRLCVNKIALIVPEMLQRAGRLTEDEANALRLLLSESHATPRILRQFTSALNATGHPADEVSVRCDVNGDILTAVLRDICLSHNIAAPFNDRPCLVEMVASALACNRHGTALPSVADGARVWKGWLSDSEIAESHHPAGINIAIGAAAEHASTLTRDLALEVYERCRAPWQSPAAQNPSGRWLVDCHGYHLWYAIADILTDVLRLRRPTAADAWCSICGEKATKVSA